MKVTATLKLLRVSKGLSQEELSKQIGISQTTISQWENGASIPTGKNIYRLAKFFAVEPTVIFDAVFKQRT